MTSSSECRLLLLLTATVVWSMAMSVEANGIAPAQRQQVPANCYFSGKPILDLELAATPDCFASVATQGAADKLTHNIGLFRVNTYMDFVFIVLYWSVFVLFAILGESRWTKWVVGLISVSALFDVLENLRILKGLAALAGSAHVAGLLPRPFSLGKWALLGLALGFLGVLVWSGKGRFARLLTTALVVSGALTLAGLLIPNAMVYAAYGFGLCFVLILARIWPYPLASVLLWIEYAYLLRFQLVAAALLALGLPLAYHFLPSVFVGLFDARNCVSFVIVVWAAFQLAWTILVTSRLVIVYGPDRFIRATSIHPSPVGAGMVSAFGVLALPVVAVLFIGTAGPGPAWKILAAVLGLLLAIGVLVLTASLHFAIEDPSGHSAEAIFPSFGFLTKATRPTSSFWAFIGTHLARLPEDLTAGILDKTRLRSGHEMAAIALAVFLVLYASLGGVFSPSHSNPENQPAALFFLLLLLTILTWFFSGAAFFLDRTRLPVLTTILVASLLTGVMRTDHEFVVRENNAPEARLSPPDILNKWKETRGKNSQTILVVATAGGGIRAAAWTAEVMTRLELNGCGAVSDSLVLVSSVSGGSVGSMFVVAPYSGKGDYPASDDELATIRFNAERSSLSAVGWGLAYPDLARTVPVLGSFVPETYDRGWSLENTWATGWREKGLETPTMKSWREDVRAGSRPAVIFNATSSETGDRFLISSTDMSMDTSSVGTERFFSLFPSGNMEVTTAARLSATFPYVSPLARPSAGPIAAAYHVGDGGYYDNSGLLSAVEWLRDAGAALKGKRILLILIDAKPGQEKVGSSWSWQRQLVGPIETLLHVRTSSQQVRDSIELEMVHDYLASNPRVDVTPIPFLFATRSPAPLSWHLTKDQLRQVGDSWAEPDNQDAWREVRGSLGCSTNPEILRSAIGGTDK
jgi:hypothetical protein